MSQKKWFTYLQMGKTLDWNDFEYQLISKKPSLMFKLPK
jgi:hypothetical protein